jgi:hypothetical protein
MFQSWKSDSLSSLRSLSFSWLCCYVIRCCTPAALAKATGTRMPFGGPLADVEAFDAATDVVNVLTYTNKSSKCVHS